MARPTVIIIHLADKSYNSEQILKAEAPVYYEGKPPI